MAKTIKVVIELEMELHSEFDSPDNDVLEESVYNYLNDLMDDGDLDFTVVPAGGMIKKYV